MKFRNIAIIAVAAAFFQWSVSAGATDTQENAERTYTNDRGNIVATEHRSTAHSGRPVKRARQFNITDAGGETLAAGRDRDWKRPDGSQGTSQAAVRYDAEGNRVLNRRQANTNADGDTRARRGKSVRDEDGHVVAKGVDGRASKDGVEYRTQQRTRVNADGETVSATRRASVDAQGNRRVMKDKSTRSQHSGRQPGSRGSSQKRGKRNGQ